ncbi:MAG: c-type cytochrome [Betaproteobacteria bacterium]|nr:c-type cytochrome [Betaproteobacteria bacterium]
MSAWARRAGIGMLLLAAASIAAAGAAGDAQRGEMLYEQRCSACHSVHANRVGPAHAGVFGRMAGTAPGYDYSPALQHAGFRWTAQRLDAWLTDPERLVPGQKMGYSVPDAADRRDLIAYLKTLTPAAP